MRRAREGCHEKHRTATGARGTDGPVYATYSASRRRIPHRLTRFLDDMRDTGPRSQHFLDKAARQIKLTHYAYRQYLALTAYIPILSQESISVGRRVGDR